MAQVSLLAEKTLNFRQKPLAQSELQLCRPRRYISSLWSSKTWPIRESTKRDRRKAAASRPNQFRLHVSVPLWAFPDTREQGANIYNALVSGLSHEPPLPWLITRMEASTMPSRRVISNLSCCSYAWIETRRKSKTNRRGHTECSIVEAWFFNFSYSADGVNVDIATDRNPNASASTSMPSSALTPLDARKSTRVSCGLSGAECPASIQKAHANVQRLGRFASCDPVGCCC